MGPAYFSPSTVLPSSPFFSSLTPNPLTSPATPAQDILWPRTQDWQTASLLTRGFRSPGTFPAERLDAAVPIRVHPDLLYNPDSPAAPYLHWNVLLPPKQCRVFSRGTYREPLLDQGAFAPSMRKLRIGFDHPILAFWQKYWGPIQVELGEGITVKAVLDAIFKYLHEPLTGPEMNILFSTPWNRETVWYVMQRRAMSGSELPMFVMNGLPKRIDVLGSHKKFQGLRVCMFNDGTWEAYMGLMPGEVPRF